MNSRSASGLMIVRCDIIYLWANKFRSPTSNISINHYYRRFLLAQRSFERSAWPENNEKWTRIAFSFSLSLALAFCRLCEKLCQSGAKKMEGKYAILHKADSQWHLSEEHSAGFISQRFIQCLRLPRLLYLVKRIPTCRKLLAPFGIHSAVKSEAYSWGNALYSVTIRATWKDKHRLMVN